MNKRKISTDIEYRITCETLKALESINEKDQETLDDIEKLHSVIRDYENKESKKMIFYLILY